MKSIKLTLDNGKDWMVCPSELWQAWDIEGGGAVFWPGPHVTKKTIVKETAAQIREKIEGKP